MTPNLQPGKKKFSTKITFFYEFFCRALSILDVRPKPKYIMLEDLRQQGYAPVDRIEGLDMENLKLVLTKLAKFHAVTAVLHTTRVRLLNWDMNVHAFITILTHSNKCQHFCRNTI